ncbi:MAG: 50S ribosomal protein L19, partial [Bacteroidales bacterium]|nr:50S ribosomal protein L19 [Bacteroidales bacterium]
MDLIKVAQEAFAGEKKEFPAFKAGDTVTVTYKIKEGDKERLQNFKGV